MQEIDYIFCISTGRCGTKYLKTLFAHIPGCWAFHEPHPIGNNDIMRKCLNNGDTEPMRGLAQQKAERIEEIRGGCGLYVETNHCFIKGFGWFLPEFLLEERLGVIILTRKRAEIVESLLRTHCTPLTTSGPCWLITPKAKSPLCPRPDERREDYERESLGWYVDETAARAKAFQKRFGRIKYYIVDIEELNTPERVSEMFKFFGCKATEPISGIGVKVGRSR